MLADVHGLSLAFHYDEIHLPRRRGLAMQAAKPSVKRGDN